MPSDLARRVFDRAVARFNAREPFEAHEDWEHLWHEASGAERTWLQGLIQLAAAFVHVERGFHATGFVKLMREGLAKAAPYDGDAWGLDMPACLATFAPWREHAERVDRGAVFLEDAPAERPRLVARPDYVPSPLPEDFALEA